MIGWFFLQIIIEIFYSKSKSNHISASQNNSFPSPVPNLYKSESLSINLMADSQSFSSLYETTADSVCSNTFNLFDFS
jgi:hypothetical protein